MQVTAALAPSSPTSGFVAAEPTVDGEPVVQAEEAPPARVDGPADEQPIATVRRLLVPALQVNIGRNQTSARAGRQSPLRSPPDDPLDDRLRGAGGDHLAALGLAVWCPHALRHALSRHPRHRETAVPDALRKEHGPRISIMTRHMPSRRRALRGEVTYISRSGSSSNGPFGRQSSPLRGIPFGRMLPSNGEKPGEVLR